MLVAIDIGNSNIVIGVYHNNNWKYQWRIVTSEEVTAIGYEMKIRQLLLDNELHTDGISGVVISSVVPNITERIASTWVNLTGLKIMVVDPINLGRMKMKLNNPYEIGSDLVANAVAAFDLFKSNCMIVDFGTALTFTTVSKNEELIGVSIVPGIKTAIKALTQNTAKLPTIELEFPDSVLGQDTVHAIRSGILYGYVGLVKEMIARNKKEVGDDLKVVATGGLSHVLHPLEGYFDVVYPTLTLDGLRLMYNSY
jgi:type III pantothenate kinase